MGPTGARDRYHHGALRRALLDEALRVIGERGPMEVSLRELARRTGVSHAAPRHHFSDKAGLLTALASEGFTRLAEALRQAYAANESFLEVGVAYVEFAVEQPAYFEVMYRPDLYHAHDSDLRAARDRARDALYDPLRGGSDGGVEATVRTRGVAAWALVHGLASLMVTGSLPGGLGGDPAEITRAVAAHLSLGLPARAD